MEGEYIELLNPCQWDFPPFLLRLYKDLSVRELGLTGLEGAYLSTTSIDDALRTVRGQRVLWLEMRLNDQFDLMPWQSARRCSSLSDGLPRAAGRPIVHLTPFSYVSRFTRHYSWTLVDFISIHLTKHP